ncbi:hypothetical protein HZH68_009790 [Vespula germanica]|uniref:Reverse transcriptase/retrotransposon-derived protein RNase H-like domain-containing protein n=1 Tax=Vespula germanica TaxID=30212 RepID=A0A834JX50_VESGE|nr:hypothetical protein HZH68_009790 [Vespula germanica]
MNFRIQTWELPMKSEVPLRTMRCYNYGKPEHSSRDCRLRIRDSKCFKQSPNLNQAQLLLIDLERAEIVRLRYFRTVIDINCEDFPATVYVVPNSAITLDIIMGCDNLLQVNVTFTKDHVLKIYYPVHAIELHSDISQYDYGTILLQKSPVDKKLHEVYYYSRKACDAKHKYPNYKLKALMIVITLKISVLFVRY